jgi:hypothetical protein
MLPNCNIYLVHSVETEPGIEADFWRVLVHNNVVSVQLLWRENEVHHWRIRFVTRELSSSLIAVSASLRSDYLPSRPSVSILLETPLLLLLESMRAYQGAHDDNGDPIDAIDFGGLRTA